eukprot:CAMPEP_0204520784 /NCGR_PEP_ID=MMETSP0661-20131031/5443_1 /ASSEMBLY_ACC=CAM_ASM_000606 /TAXON_ID=109239 /ORGANISM="Alexandrium margalefi, Strain AMGDE01CS-322" /LENGTH=460 /DNA_ID=CAMNT_0051526353 /DNA_START=39 /DNA_END=1417 /DNA_ORIENTATION=+
MKAMAPARAARLLGLFGAPLALALRRAALLYPPAHIYESDQQQCAGNGSRALTFDARGDPDGSYDPTNEIPDEPGEVVLIQGGPGRGTWRKRRRRRKRPGALSLLEEELQNASFVPEPVLVPELSSLLNGTQWCEGSTAPAELLGGRVALIMVGQAFRSKNFVSNGRATCTEGTVPVQERLARNHLKRVVRPIEAELGMEVDVFLTDTPCGEEWRYGDHSFEPYEGEKANFDGATKLLTWYGEDRVKGVAKTDLRQSMYGRVGTTFRMVDSYMRRTGGTYEYFIVLRYDVFFDEKFLKMLRTQLRDPAHGGLSFFGHTHDYVVSFPGELWGCMLRVWRGCMESSANAGSGGSREERRVAGCFDFGPLRLTEWVTGFGYVNLLSQIKMALWRAGRWEMITDKAGTLPKNGTSAFDVGGARAPLHRPVVLAATGLLRGPLHALLLPRAVSRGPRALGRIQSR